MSPFRVALLLATVITLLGAVSMGAVGAPAHTGSVAAEKISPNGVGGVKLGQTYNRLRQQRLIGKIHGGCNVAGPSARSARLRPPLTGNVDFTPTSPRKVTNISVRGGATARGIGTGAALANILAAYPQAKVDHSTESMFGITLVRIPKTDGGKLQFALDAKTKKVTLIGIPVIAFCE